MWGNGCRLDGIRKVEVEGRLAQGYQIAISHSVINRDCQLSAAVVACSNRIRSVIGCGSVNAIATRWSALEHKMDRSGTS